MQITKSIALALLQYRNYRYLSPEFKMFISRKASRFLVLTTILFAGSNKKAQGEAFDECYDDSDCEYGYISRKYCCEKVSPENNVCKSNCLAENCIFDSDCAPGECCASNDICSESDCDSITTGLAGWIVAVIVTGVLLVIVLPVAIIVFCCFCADAAASSRRPQLQGGVVFSQLQQPTTTTFLTSQQLQPHSGQRYFQNPPPYPNPNPGTSTTSISTSLATTRVS